MNIDLRRFVDINIQQHVDSTLLGTRDTVALFTEFGTKGKTYPSYDDPTKLTNIVVNMKDAHRRYDSQENSTKLLQYLEVFFENGGGKVAVYEGYGQVVADDIKSLPDEQICVAMTGMLYNECVNIAHELQTDDMYGVKEKLIFTSISDHQSILLPVKNLIVKYSRVQGSQMSIMAYLSKIDVYGSDTVFDYAFTQENLPAEDISDDVFNTLMTNNINVNIFLANASRVCGGNCSDGAEITNNFVRIVLHQTLTNRLLQVLVQKIKSNSGLGKLYTAVVQEMSYYLSSGYLTTDKVWSDETLYVTHNGQQYPIIEKGTALTNGYIVKILPLQSLSDEDKLLHKAPMIYVILADQYSIRKITINGEVI